jgi:hypothetical protein
MDNWYAFKAYNAQTRHGYGTAQEADAYADHLNANRTINLFAPYLDDAGHESDDAAFSLSIALADIRDNAAA